MQRRNRPPFFMSPQINMENESRERKDFHQLQTPVLLVASHCQVLVFMRNLSAGLVSLAFWFSLSMQTNSFSSRKPTIASSSACWSLDCFAISLSLCQLPSFSSTRIWSISNIVWGKLLANRAIYCMWTFKWFLGESFRRLFYMIHTFFGLLLKPSWREWETLQVNLWLWERLLMLVESLRWEMETLHVINLTLSLSVATTARLQPSQPLAPLHGLSKGSSFRQQLSLTP